MSQALNKASKQLLVDEINKTNGKNFALADLIFGTPQPEGDRPHQNTMVSVNLATKPDAADSISLFYNRIDLGAMFASKLVEVVDTGTYNNVGDLIAYINSTYGLGLTTADDIVDDVFTVGTKPFVVHVKAKPESLVYTGQFQILIVDAISDPTPDIDAFDQTLGDAFQQANSDKLFIDDGMLDDGHFLKTQDLDHGIILALRARADAVGPQAPVSPTSNSYDLTAAITAAGGNWMADYAFQFDMAAREGHVTDYYDVQLIVKQPGKELPLTLTETNGVFTLVNGALSIPVDYVYNRGEQLQGELDMAVIFASAEAAAVFTTATKNPDGAPYGGTYSAKVVANRKGNADDMHETWVNAIV